MIKCKRKSEKPNIHTNKNPEFSSRVLFRKYSLHKESVMKFSVLFFVIYLTIAVIPAKTCAATVNITSDIADAQVFSQAVQGSFLNSTITNMSVGRNGNVLNAAVLVFELPTIAPGEIIANANLSFTSEQGSITDVPNADLYGLDFRVSSTVLAADFFAGSNDSSALKIQDNILTNTMPLGEVAVTTDNSGDSALVSYLTAQLANGAQAGDFVFLRLNIDEVIPSSGNVKNYKIFSASNPTPPILTIETLQAIPEPSTISFCFLALFMVSIRKKFYYSN